MGRWTPVPKHKNVYSYETMDGKKYAIRKTFYDNTGKRQEYSKSGFDSWRDAEVVLTQFNNSINLNIANPIINEKRKLDEVFAAMKESRIKAEMWKKGTAKNVTNYYKKYLKPTFGNTQIGKINRLAYESFLATLPAKGLADTTMHTINSTMQLIMNFAEHHDIILKNRLSHPDMPNGKAPRNKTIEVEDYKVWMETAKDRLNRYEYSIVMLSSLGERRGELMGLRLEDLEFADGACAIHWTINRTTDEPEGTTLKTESSYRTNVITGYMLDHLKFIIEHSKAIKANYGMILHNSDFILINEDTGFPLFPTHLNRIYEKVNADTGLHFTPHMLRHYFATVGLNNPNISDVEIMHWLGHTDLKMTAAYSRSTETQSKATFDKVQSDLHVVKPGNNDSSVGEIG